MTVDAGSPNVPMMPPLMLGVLGLCRLALRAVLPVDCIACARPLRRDPTPYFCDACWQLITPLSGPRCVSCDQPFASKAVDVWTPAHRCQRCLERPPSYDRVWTLYPYISPLKDAICAFKFRHVLNLANPLAALMIRALPAQLDADLIVPVPLHPSRLRAREFNQSLLIADRLGRHLGRPVSTTNLVRIAATEPQTSLSRRERLRNLRHVFMVNNVDMFEGRRVLLIDDVFTTGTTLNECAKALYSTGAASVLALTLARTMDSHLVPDRYLAEHNTRLFAGPRS